MRDEKEERKKQARSNKQTRQNNTAHPTCIVQQIDKALALVATYSLTVLKCLTRMEPASYS